MRNGGNFLHLNRSSRQQHQDGILILLEGENNVKDLLEGQKTHIEHRHLLRSQPALLNDMAIWYSRDGIPKFNIRNINAANDCPCTDTTEIRHKANFKCESHLFFIQQNLHHLRIIMCLNLLKLLEHIIMLVNYSCLSNNRRWDILVLNSKLYKQYNSESPGCVEILQAV